MPASRLRGDTGVWAWLALRFFDQLCPPNHHGRRTEIRENAKYISNPADHRFGPDKHLLFFPWKMVSLHGEHSRCFLAGAPGSDTRAQREWTSYHFNVSTPLIALGARLYGDPKTNRLKSGAVSNLRRGNLRRFIQVVKQLEVTYTTSAG